MDFKEKWESIDPELKPKLVMGGVISVIVLFVVLMTDAPDKMSHAKEQEEVEITNILTPVNPRDLGMNSVQNRITKLQERNNQLVDSLESFKREQELRAQAQKISDQKRNEEIQNAVNKLNIAVRDLDTFKQTVSATAVQSLEQATKDSSSRTAGTDGPTIKYVQNPAAAGIFASEQNIVDDSFGQSALDDGNPEHDLRPDIRDIFDEEALTAKTIVKDKEQFRQLPLGSVLQGVLLTGLDAPTKTTGSTTEHPVLIRIKKEAILPNNRRSDFKECFVLAAGHGDLSSSRVFLRTEGISCVTPDGGVIDKPLKAYAVGEDDKQGLRGRVVNKQGAIISRALWANFLKGWASSFGDTGFDQQLQGLEIQTDAAGVDKLKDSLSGSRFADSAIRGTANAVDRLAQFYIDMADSMTPVVELDAGRSITLVITSGTQFKVGQN